MYTLIDKYGSYVKHSNTKKVLEWNNIEDAQKALADRLEIQEKRYKHDRGLKIVKIK